MTKSWLSPVLQAWLGEPHVGPPSLDCHGCAKPAKCCDFQPFVANFLVGAILSAQPDWLWRGDQFQAQPLGLIPTREYRRRHGLGERLACAFFDRGQCTIWRYRPGECSTYFCQGLAHSELSEKAFALETMVAQHALRAQGFTLPLIHAQVDLLNLEEGAQSENFDIEHLKKIYQKSWTWAGQLRREEVEVWFNEFTGTAGSDRR